MTLGYLTVNPDSPDSYCVELEEGTVLSIGRKSAQEGQAKLVIPVPEVSGQHAKIRWTASGWILQDSGSTNGTRLNGDWLTPGREYRLQSGDRIKIAHVDLLVELPEGLPRTEPEINSQQSFDRAHLRISLINATILVADIRGFTALVAQFPEQPEVVMEAAQHIFADLNEEITRRQGVIEKIVGETILSYWPSQGINSNAHAILACQTALQLRQLAEKLAREPRYWPFPDHPLNIDMALASGPVATGVLGSQETNPAVVGDTANLAFRLEKLVGEDHPGDILADGRTRALTRENFEYTALGTYKVKGRQGEVDVYRLLGALAQRK